MKDTIIQYFENYPESDSCHETSDGFLFHKKSDAESHGRTLDDKKVESYSRDVVVSSQLSVISNEAVEETETVEPTETLTDEVEVLQEVEPLPAKKGKKTEVIEPKTEN